MKKTEFNKDAQVAELPDDSEFDLGANYDVRSIEVEDPDPSMKYFFAVKDDGGGRPDSVYSCKRMGYEVSKKKCSGSPDCLLMEIPLRVFEARQKARMKRDAEDLRQEMQPKGEQFTVSDSHGTR